MTNLTTLKKFNIRVYGLLIEEGKLLVCDEIVRGGRRVTKFPGGGLELGEGPIECLEREFLEETGFKVKVAEHFYTTDFFQQSAFNPDDQIISIYYRVHRTSDFNPGHELPKNEKEVILGFRWLELTTLNEDAVSLPVDKVVVRRLINLSEAHCNDM